MELINHESNLPHVEALDLPSSFEAPPGELSEEARLYNSRDSLECGDSVSGRHFDLLIDFYETEKCPFQCKNCVQTDHSSVAFDLIPIVNALDSALQEKGKQLFLYCNGGEPTLKMDRILEYQEIGVPIGMVTVGLYRVNDVKKFIEADNTIRVNISVLGSPETEHQIRQLDVKKKDFYRRDWLHELADEHKRKVSLLYIIYQETLDSRSYLKDIKWIMSEYPDMPLFISYDRFETNFNPHLLMESYNLIHTWRKHHLMDNPSTPDGGFYVGNRRICPPTTFINGEYFQLELPDNEKMNIHWKDVLDDPIGFFNKAIYCHNISARHAAKHCDVWKKYECGGPGCRFGYQEFCRAYWKQMIPLGDQVHDMLFV